MVAPRTRSWRQLGAAHEVVVGGDHAGRDEDVLLQRAVRGDVGVRLDPRARADRGVVLDAPRRGRSPPRSPTVHRSRTRGQIAHHTALAEHAAGRDHRSGRDAAAVTQPQRRQLTRVWPSTRPTAWAACQHRVVSDGTAVARSPSPVHGHVGPEVTPSSDQRVRGRASGRGVGGRPHHARAPARAPPSPPPRSSARCIASSTSTTARPSSTLARTASPAATASRNRPHSSRSGSSREMRGDRDVPGVGGDASGRDHESPLS